MSHTLLAAPVVVAEGAAYLAGLVVGRLLFLGLGLWLLATGFRRRQDPTSSSRGLGFIIGGAVLLLGVVAGLTSAGTSGTSP